MKIFWLAFIMGLICGGLIYRYYNQTATVTHEHIKTETLEQKATAVETVQNVVEEKRVTKKTYFPSGKLKSETVTDINHINLAQQVSTERYSLNVLSDIKKTEEQIQIQKDLMIGVSYPLLDLLQPFNYQHLSVLIGYRLFYNVYLFGEFDLRFSRYSIGVLALI